MRYLSVVVVVKVEGPPMTLQNKLGNVDFLSDWRFGRGFRRVLRRVLRGLRRGDFIGG